MNIESTITPVKSITGVFCLLWSLFKRTQNQPQAEEISEDMIAEEIEEYRAGR
jgi:hypothetical protein